MSNQLKVAEDQLRLHLDSCPACRPAGDPPLLCGEGRKLHDEYWRLITKEKGAARPKEG